MRREVIDKETGEVVSAPIGTDAEKFIGELDGGVFIEKLGVAHVDVLVGSFLVGA